MIEKVLGRHCDAGSVTAGEIVVARPDVILLNDVSGPVAIEQFKAMGGSRVHAPDRIVLVADHFAPAKDVQSAEAIQVLRGFGEEQDIPHYYDTGNGGIEHAVIAELGLVQPGTLVFGADSHTCTAGALNASGVGFGSSDLAAAMALGELWLRVPETIRIDLTGRIGRFVSGKDVILAVLRLIGSDGALNAALEFGGPGLASLNIDERMAVANMAVEGGAETCVLEHDGQVTDYLAARSAATSEPVSADPGAAYLARHSIDLDRLEPLIALPPSPANVVPVSEAAHIRVQQIYIGNCSNGTLTDLRQTAAVLEGRKVARGVRMIVVPATQQIYRAAMREGLLETIAAAGATISPPTCGACFGGHMGILAAGETAVATTNRNFRGRMGHPDSKVYLSNAWVAAAAAVAGEIVNPATVMSEASVTAEAHS
jgi:3-isopropylmalate/(R)-2-methylmalate dehydratase large subunit